MSIENAPRLDPLAPLADASAPASKAEVDDPAGFGRLLESLERLAAEHRQAKPIAHPDGVQDAVARADEGFSLAMDLRRQLEDAFRKHMP